MQTMTRSLIVFMVSAATALPAMSDLVKTDRIVREFPVNVVGAFWIDNPTGPIDITGVPGDKIYVMAVRTITAPDEGGLAAGWNQTNVVLEGNNDLRYLRTIVPVMRKENWKSSVAYTIRVPRSVHVKIASSTAEHISVSNISGNVEIRNFNGRIILDGVIGATKVDTVNGSVTCNFAVPPTANVQLSSVNGSIDVHVPSDSNFDWVADSIRGLFFTTMPVRARFSGSVLRGGVNSPGGPTITTASLTGRVFILKNGTAAAQARQITAKETLDPIPQQTSGAYQQAVVEGPLVMSVPFGNVAIGQVHGSARVDTGVGAISLDAVWGDATLFSTGGPMSLGDMFRPVTAHTRAGDILVRAARDGGNITTDGGTIRLLYNGGPTILRSGGGDIIARQAAGPIDAETHSGDVTITVDPNARTQKLTARTIGRGNIILNLTPNFAADVDATIVTSDPDTYAMHSDFPGLTIRRESVGNRTRIHATGKINGGGERVELNAEDGEIHLGIQASAPITVVSQ